MSPLSPYKGVPPPPPGHKPSSVISQTIYNLLVPFDHSLNENYRLVMNQKFPFSFQAKAFERFRQSLIKDTQTFINSRFINRKTFIDLEHNLANETWITGNRAFGLCFLRIVTLREKSRKVSDKAQSKFQNSIPETSFKAKFTLIDNNQKFLANSLWWKCKATKDLEWDCFCFRSPQPEMPKTTLHLPGRSFVWFCILPLPENS